MRRSRRPFSNNTSRPRRGGLKSPNYSNKGRHPYGDDWPLVSSQVRVRDNYSCRANKIGLPKCNNRFPPPYHHLLHVHHIVPWAKCKRNDPRNLITLCKDCHSLSHGKSFGNKITNKQKQTIRYS